MPPVTDRRGDGWTTCRRGHRHWGRFGAAGLLVRRPGIGELPDATSRLLDDPAIHQQVLLQLRADWSHHGGTWGIPGGARDLGEDAVQAALREAAEEAAVDPAGVHVEAVFLDDHGGWSYQTVLASGSADLTATATSRETTAVRWVGTDELADLPLHPGFAASWPLLHGLPAAPRVLVDAANVVGARPDGWWRDRRGATARLRDGLAALGVRGWPARALPEPWSAASDLRWFPVVIMVTEGRARGVPPVEGVQITEAPASGDDAIVELVGPHPVERTSLVITADRELARRVAERGGVVAGPGRLLDLIDQT